MEREDPPLLGNIRNIFQRFFPDVYQPPPPPTTTVTDAQVEEELRQREEEERLREEEEKRSKKRPPSSGKKPPPKDAKKPVAKSPGGAKTPKSEEGEEAVEEEIPVAEPQVPDAVKIKFQLQIEELEAKAAAVAKRNNEQEEELRRRRQELFKSAVEATPFDADACVEHGTRLGPSCIDISGIISRHDEEFCTQFCMPSLLTEAPDYPGSELGGTFRNATWLSETGSRRGSDYPEEPARGGYKGGYKATRGNKTAAPTSPRESLGFTASQKKMQRSMSGTMSLSMSKKKRAKTKAFEDPTNMKAERASMVRMNAIANHLINPRYGPPGHSTLARPKLKENTLATSVAHLKYVQPLVPKPLRYSDLATGQGSDVPSQLSAEPEVLFFTDYQVGGIYETELVVRNVAAVACRCRVIPPETPFFSVTLNQKKKKAPQSAARNPLHPEPEEPPSSGVGLLAPGMSVSYSIRFTPDTLSNFEDKLLVCTEWSSLPVPLIASRPPPELSLPEVLDCGSCIVEGNCRQTLKVMNTGGDGSFTFSESPDSFSAPEDDLMPLHPFIIKPKTFSLRSGECQDIRVEFQPMADETYERKLYLFCDNLDILQYTVKGSGVKAFVVLKAVQDNTVNKDQGDAFASNNCMLNFGDLSAGSRRSKTVTYHNPTNLPIRFHWRVEVSDLDAAGPVAGTGVFCITPDQGSFAPNSKKKFTVDFNPLKAVGYKGTLNLVLEGLPSDASVKAPYQPRPPVHEKVVDSTGFFSTGAYSNSINEVSRNMSTAVSNVDVTGAGLPLDVKLYPPSFKNMNVPFVAGNNLLNTRQVQLINNSERAVTFCFDPDEYEAEGIHTSTEMELHRLAQLRSLQQDDDIKSLERGVRVLFFPRLGTVNPRSTTLVNASFAFLNKGTVKCSLPVVVQGVPKPMSLSIEANVQGPKVRVEPPVVDFGIVYAEHESESRMTVVNSSDIPVSFKITNREDVRRLDEWKKENPGLPEDQFKPRFTFAPNFGKIQGRQNTVVSVFYDPDMIGSLSEQIEVSVAGADPCLVDVRGEVQAPNGCIVPSMLSAHECHMDVPITKTVILQNLTSIPTEFQWAVIEDVEKAETTFSETKGLLTAGEKREIEITVVAHRPGPLRLLIPCCLSGMKDPIVCCFTCEDVHGAAMSFNVSKTRPLSSDTDAEDGRTIEDYCAHLLNNIVNGVLEEENSEYLPVLDYAQVRLGEPAVQYLVVRNHSGSKIEFNSYFMEYSTPKDYGSLLKAVMDPPMDKSGSVLSNVHEKVNPFECKGGFKSRQTKTKEEQLIQLTNLAVQESGGQGAAFVLETPGDKAHVVMPGALYALPVHCLVNVPGVYETTLICTGSAEKGLPEARIPVRIEALGAVVSMQNSCTPGLSLTKENGAILKFPPLILTGAPDARNKKMLKLNNNCPRSLDVDWEAMQGDDCFVIEPSKFTVAPNSTYTFHATFKPPPIIENNTFSAITKCIPQYGPAFDLQILASTTTPFLTCQPSHIKFKEVPITSGAFARTLRLTNEKSKEMTFSVAIQGGSSALQIVKLCKIRSESDPEPGPTNVVLSKQSQYTLFPTEALDVTVEFNPTMMTFGATEQDLGTSNVRTVDDCLVVNYGGYAQEVDITAVVQVPSLQADRNELVWVPDDGDAQWPKSITLINRSIVPAEYSITYVPNAKPVSTVAKAPMAAKPSHRVLESIMPAQPMDDPDVFHISPMYGTVLGKAHNQAGTQEVTIKFNPAGPRSYSSTFRVNVMYGLGCELELTGHNPLVELGDATQMQ